VTSSGGRRSRGREPLPCSGLLRRKPGLRPWNPCMVARARLEESNRVLKLAGFSRALEGEDLMDTAQAMLPGT
jgi:hypothetical protein